MKKSSPDKHRSDRNKTMTLQPAEVLLYKSKLKRISCKCVVADIINSTIHQNIFEVIEKLPESFVDLLFVDPPYNLTKVFNSNKFSEMTPDDYEQWLESWLNPLRKVLKKGASVYICGDWKSSSAIFRVMNKYFKVKNRITWEREKGRGAKSNWKNCSEDIWFATVDDDYVFNTEAVMLKKKVVAPYRDTGGNARDWTEEQQGNFRLTHPSNLWTDLTVPFWSMPENTDHPTQKPEKLLAKIILASSEKGDVVFDPFLGSGTTSVVAKKLGRRYCGVEIDEKFACLAEKRLSLADKSTDIQGYTDGKFWERNSLNVQKKFVEKKKYQPEKNKIIDLFSYEKQLISR